MGTTIFRNEQNLGTNDVLKLFSSTLQQTELYTKSEIEDLADIYSKNIVDKFIVTDEDGLEETFGRQGDILFWKKGSEMYKQEYKRVRNLKVTDRTVLQPDDSMTGDHRFIPVQGSTYTIKEGTFYPSFLEKYRRTLSEPFPCIVIETDKPFLVVHREHGNIAMPAGKYMVCSQIDPATLNRMID